MTRGERPDWLAAFQASFGAMVRAPLDRSTGTLRADPARYSAELRDASRPAPALTGPERLSAYNVQYWLRLFGFMQNAFPLCARLLQYWTFNEHVTRFLVECPPSHARIDRVADRFESFMVASLPANVALGSSGVAVGREPLLEALRIDAAWRDVFLAPLEERFRPTPADAGRATRARLKRSPSAALIQENWPLMELRRGLGADESEALVALPARLPEAHWWGLVRRDAGIGQLRFERREGELLALLAKHPVPVALGLLEQACTEAERSLLPAKAHAWVARSVELGFWCGWEE